MAEQDPAVLMSTAFAAIAARDLDALSATHHDDVVENFMVLGPVTGKDSARAFFAELFTAFPDSQFTAKRVMGVDNTVAVGEWKLWGTFSGGPFRGIEPTGREITLEGLDVMEFEHGLLKYNTIYYDGLSFARQVGLLPPEGTRRDRAITTAFNTLARAKAKLARK